MGNCKDCKWWEPSRRSQPALWGQCEGVAGACIDSPDDYAGINPDEALVVVAGDYFGASAAFRTGPLFGCVLFEPRKADKIG